MELKENDLISIIIPTYNRENYLEEAINSVLSQTYQNIEIIVVDDGSVINYAEKICNKYEKCRYLYQINGGLSSARNYGIKFAKGDFIALLDDDDLFMLNKLEKQIKVLINDNTIDCVHSSASVIDGNGIEIGVTIGATMENAYKRSGDVFWNALGNWGVKSPTPLFRKKIFDTLLFDEQIKVGEDLDFYQRMFYSHKVFYFAEPLAFYREYNDSKRLSKMREEYIGIESKIFRNFLNMGIKNPFILYRIALKLAKSGIRNWNDTYRNKELKVNKIKLILNPFYYVLNYQNMLC